MKNHFFMRDEISTNLKYICSAFCGVINRKDLIYKYDGKEDMRMSLQRFKADGGVMRMNNLTMKTKYYGKGGISSSLEDRVSKTKEYCEEINKEFPDNTTIYQRKNGVYEIRLKKRNFIEK